MNSLDHALDDCLARLASGEASLEECLQRYPQHAEELRRLLETAAQLKQGRALRPAPGTKRQARDRLVAYMRAHPRGRYAKGLARLTRPLPLRIASGLAVAVLLFLAAGTALAQSALPGHTLYTWKIASERIWRVFQPDPLAADLTLAKRRAREMVLVAGNPQAEQQAREGYQQSLDDVAHYTDTASQPILYAALSEQKDILDEAGLAVPELDRLLVDTAPSPPQPEFTATPPPEVTPPVVPTLTLPVLSPTPNVPVTTAPPSAPSPALSLTPASPPSTASSPVALPSIAPPEATPLLESTPTLPLPMPTLPLGINTPTP